MTGDETRRGAHAFGITLMVIPEAPRLAPGDKVELRLVVTTTEPDAPPTRYHLDVMGLRRRWYTFGETDIVLGPGAPAMVALTLHPELGQALPGRYPFRVRAAGPPNPSIAATAVVMLTVAPTDEPAVPPEQPVAAVPPERPALRTPWSDHVVPPLRLNATAAGGTMTVDSAQRRRISVAAGLGVLLIVLYGEGATLASRLNAPRSASKRAAMPVAPLTSPNRPNLPPEGSTPRTPYRLVAGARTTTPVIRRFTIVRGGPDRPGTLTWQTENAAVVTIDGQAAPPSGTRVIHPSLYGSSYTLRAGTRGHVATASVHTVAASPIAVAASVPVALTNLIALRFPDRAVGATTGVQIVRMVNLGPTPLTIAGISVDGDRADFSVHAPCARHPLPVDASCAIDVRFTPTRRGPRHAILAVADNTAAGSERVRLDGVGM